MAPKSRFSRGDGVGGVCPVGLGSHLVYAHIPHSQLRPERRRSRSGHGPYPLGGRHHCDRRHRLDPVAPGHGRSAAGRLAVGGGRRTDHRSVLHRLLDPFTGRREMDVLAVHSGHLLLHRALHGLDAESGSASHACHVHRLVPGGRQCVQPDHRTPGRRTAERLVRRQSWSGRAFATAGIAGARANGILGGVSFLHGEQDHRGGSEARNRLCDSGRDPLKTILCMVFCTIGMACHAESGIKVLNDDAHYPEGPIWYQGKLYYVEYDRNAVMTWDGTKNAVFAAEKGCGQSAVVPTVHGEFLTTCYDNGTIGRMSADGTVLPAYTQDKDGRKFTGPNDFAPDGRGGIYFTASGTPPGALDGKVFYIAPDGVITLEADGLHNANGIAVSKDGKIL